ncbi:MAG: hypothetical protein JSV37_00755 [Anaerolineaceae bacterium]|nr:MAG: hypothetical protein JSV37_00755 [Anaerolineaceae bacterium]
MRRFTVIAMAVLGTAMIGLAILATRLGIDHDNVWGLRRLSLFIVGVLLLFLSTLLLSYEGVFLRLDDWKKRISGFLSHLRGVFLGSSIVRFFVGYINKFTTRFGTVIYRIPFVKLLVDKFGDQIQRITRLFRNSPVIQYLSASKERKARLVSWSLFAVIVLIYVWLVSVGRWTNWPGTTDYYEMLANAFHHGQTHLRIDPDTRLLELPDPYDYEARKHIPIPWDVVLYEGKFYLYWGPVPGLILAGLRFVIPHEIGDEYLVFGFVTGLLFFSVHLILAIWHDIFHDSPWWIVVPGVLVAGLGNPIPWLLTRPAVYEAAISSAQFFLIAGIYWAFTALRCTKPVKWRLLLAGTCWALAVASRITLVMAIAFMIWMVLFRICKTTPKVRTSHRNVWASVALISPLVLGVIGLGWYNYVRFGSLAEFGFRYALTLENYYQRYGITLSNSYIVYNLFNYLVNSFRFLPVFPFVKPIWGKHHIWLYNKWAPEHYHVEQVAGILITTPYVLFAIIPIIILLWKIFGGRSVQSSIGSDPCASEISASENWLITALMGAVVLAFFPLLIFLYSTMRYLADFIPILALLAIIGSFQGSRITSRRKIFQRSFITILTLTALISSLLGFLLSVTGYTARFENLNPELFDKIERLLAW